MKHMLWNGKIHFLILLCMITSLLPMPVLAEGQVTDSSVGKHHFTIQKKVYLESEDCYMYHLIHKGTGASVVFKDNKSIKKGFAISFASSAQDDKGANHVLEHVLLGGTQTYPTKNLHYILQGSSAATMMNGFTQDDAVSYVFETNNAKDFDNLLGLHLDMVFNPLIKTEEKLFKMEGIRREFVDGKARYNGAAYNEVRTGNGIIDETYLENLKTLFPNSLPGYDSGGTPEAMRNLTYEDLMEVYNTYYKPSNSMTFLSGDIDLDGSLKVLDRYLSQDTTPKPDNSYGKSPAIPQEKYTTYQSRLFGTDSSNCVVSTVVGPKVSDTKDYLAAYILTDGVMNQFVEKYPGAYFGSTEGNGFLTSSVLLQNVSEEQGKQAAQEYIDGYKEYRGMEKEQIQQLIQKYQQQRELYSSWTLEVFQVIRGFLYTGDPLCFFQNTLYDALAAEDGSYFDKIIDQYFINNPYQLTTFGMPDETIQPSEQNEIQASPEELEKIKQETAAFEEWANTPDSQEVLDRIPKLNPEDFKEMPYDYQVKQEKVGTVPFITTKSAQQQKKESVILSFDLSSLNTDEIPISQFAIQVLTSRLKEQGIMDIWMQAYSNPGRYDGDKIKPTLDINITATAEELPGRVRAVKDVLSDVDFLSPDKIQPFFADLREQSKQTAQGYYTYDIWMGETCDGHRWNQLGPAPSAGGSYAYYNYLKELEKNGLSSAAQQLKEAKDKIFNQHGFTVYFQGTEGTKEKIKAEIPELASLFSDESFGNGIVTLPEKKHSATTIENDRTVAGVSLIGNFESYSGQMQVMAKVLESNYLIPMLRGQGGAYGASATVSSYGSFYVSAARVPDILPSIKVFEGMGDYLRNLNLTDKELDQFIIAAISSLDNTFIEWGGNVGHDVTLDRFTMEDVQKERQEILSTTVEDLRSFADEVDRIVAEKRTFIMASQKMVDQSGIKAQVTENLEDLFNEASTPDEVTHEPYIFGMDNGLFEPDRTLTRAEAAALLARVLDGERNGEQMPFTDVAPDAWYAEAVQKLYQMGIMLGHEDGAFQPEETITGEQFGLIAARAGNLPEDFVLPSGAVSRADAVRIINAILGRSADEASLDKAVKFEDVPQDHPAYKDIIEASTKHTCELTGGMEHWTSVN